MSTATAAKARPEGLTVERRSTQEVVEVSVRFVLSHAGGNAQGVRLSRRHLVVAAGAHETSLFERSPRDVEVHVRLDGFDLVLPLKVAASAANTSASGEVRLDIVHMDERTEVTLVQLVRTALTGWLPGAEDLARGWDDETPIQAAPAPAPQRKGIHWLPITASLLVLATGLCAAAFQIYLSATTIRTDAAAVTAARYDIVSSEYGVVGAGVRAAGSTVETGQPLVRIRSAEIDSALAEQQATVESLSPPSSSLPLRGVASTDPAVIRWQRETGRLDALKRRDEALSFFSKCTCTVLWSAPEGSAVAPGALVMSLVVSDPKLIRIEALVKPTAALSVRPGQAARVTPSGQQTQYAATVQQVRYQTSPVPTIGLGATRDDRPTVILTLDDPSLELVPGTPVEVLILR
jgi:hypothetical protein